MRLIALLCLGLAACASPAPQFFGADRHDITLSGIDFVVFHKEDRAEVIRLGYLSRSARAPVPALMVEAAERTTGCRVVPGSAVTGLPGDTGEVRLELDC
ncbi:hypothetical protein GVY41_14740 [Frigidibacter albus]|uniref:Lipoprotein n=1 Tax=Frigidibacter albus TaxID=1465486 RepID=A0A6L8VIS8_9RHOB|nr:hypothetical protein [Frigidibacter albus]MZQ90245.1 hypothetical protein [Frigidibacter albus]NBE32257.1 hypothetical protein [Frigidibacter albus]GGH58334.1 hypothetical protein GCM10011341_28620 [Frigidibacter albus]